MLWVYKRRGSGVLVCRILGGWLLGLREGRKRGAIGTHQPGNVRTVVLEFLVDGACELGSCGMPSPRVFCRRRERRKKVGLTTSLSLSLSIMMVIIVRSEEGRKRRSGKLVIITSCLTAYLLEFFRRPRWYVRYANPVRYNRAKRLPAACPPFYSTDS